MIKYLDVGITEGNKLYVDMMVHSIFRLYYSGFIVIQEIPISVDFMGNWHLLISQNHKVKYPQKYKLPNP